nr:hypothetical protein [Pseudomonadota bacterium]
MISDADALAVWGDVFEIAVKRGVLACLYHDGLLDEGHPVLEEWSGQRCGGLARHLQRQLEVTDQNLAELIDAAVAHFLHMGYGLGWTCLREYLASLGHPLGESGHRRRYRLEAIWCPFALPDRRHAADAGAWEGRDFARQSQQAAGRFWKAFGLSGQPDPERYARTGQPVRADFLLLLAGRRGRQKLLVMEFSMNVPAELADYRTAGACLQELMGFARHRERRGVFARIAAEVAGDGFTISRGLEAHLAVLARRNKPLYKFFQGCAYAASSVDLLRQRQKLDGDIQVNVIAVTNNGVEGVVADFRSGAEKDVREQLLRHFGAVYCRARTLKPGEADPAALRSAIRGVFRQMVLA